MAAVRLQHCIPSSTANAGAVDLKALDIDGAGSIATGVHAVLSRCLHTLNLFKVS